MRRRESKVAPAQLQVPLASFVSARNTYEKPVDKKKQDFSIVYFIVALAVMFIAQYFLLSQQIETISYSQFKTLLKKGQVAEVVVRDKTIGGSIKSRGTERNFYRGEDQRTWRQAPKNRWRFWPFGLMIARLTAELGRSRHSVSKANRPAIGFRLCSLGLCRSCYFLSCGVF